MLATLLLLAVIHLSVVFLSIYVAPFLSIVTALVTKADASPVVKALVNLFLALALTQTTAAIQAGGLTLDRSFFVAFGTAFVLSVASYYGLWKPVGIAGRDGIVARKVSGGIG